MGDTQAGGQCGLVGQWDKAADILQIDLYHVKTSSSVQCNYLPYRTTFPAKIQGEKRDFPPLFPFPLRQEHRLLQKIGEHPAPAAPRNALRRQNGHRQHLCIAAAQGQRAHLLALLYRGRQRLRQIHPILQ